MENPNISILITEICHKLDITYHSKKEKVIEIFKDALKLAQIYLDLKIIIGALQEIEEKYCMDEGLASLLEDDINKLSTIDHDVFNLARRLKED